MIQNGTYKDKTSVVVCSKCKSIHVEYTGEKKEVEGIMYDMVSCKECGYSAPISAMTADFISSSKVEHISRQKKFSSLTNNIEGNNNDKS